ncbi:tectonin domain-containing protein [Streptomyces bobili]|uniref:tectonin domain-containing protein n=1 Tax=Streptomyces bobili TaxID=67280 RepID=UPI0037F850D5
MSASAFSQPARADFSDDVEKYATYAGYVGKAYSAYQLFFGHQLTLQQATDQLQASIEASRDVILAEIGQIPENDVRACTRAAVIELGDIENKSPDSLQAFAVSATECVTKAQSHVEGLSSLPNVDGIGFALNTVGPIALVARSRAGFSTTLLRETLVDTNNRLIERLNPSCNPIPIPEHPITEYWLRCVAYNGDIGQVKKKFITNPGTSLPFEAYAVPRATAMARTSYGAAAKALVRLTGPDPSLGSPLALSLGSGQKLSLFGVSQTGRILNRSQTAPASDAWSGWNEIGGEMLSIASETNGAGQIELFGVNSVGEIWHRVQSSSGTWSAWTQMDGTLTSIALAKNGAGRLELFGTNENGDLWHRFQLPETDQWSSWNLMATSMYNVAADTNADGRVEVFSLGKNGEVWHRWQLTGGGWSAWSQFDGYLKNIAVARDEAGDLHLFGTNPDGRIWYKGQQPGGWSNWISLPGTRYGVAVERGADNRLELFTVDASGKPSYRTHSRASGWSEWSELDGNLRP